MWIPLAGSVMILLWFYRLVPQIPHLNPLGRPSQSFHKTPRKPRKTAGFGKKDGGIACFGGGRVVQIPLKLFSHLEAPGMVENHGSP